MRSRTEHIFFYVIKSRTHIFLCVQELDTVFLLNTQIIEHIEKVCAQFMWLLSIDGAGQL